MAMAEAVMRARRAVAVTAPVRRLQGTAAMLLPVALIAAQLIALGANGGVLGAGAALADLLAAALLLALVPAPPALWRRALPVLLPILAALLWALAGGAAAAVPQSGLALGLALLLGPVALGLSGLVLGAQPGGARRAVRLIAAAGALWLVIGFALYAADPWRVWGVDKGLRGTRFSATLLSPNSAGCVMALLALLAMALLLQALGAAAGRYWMRPRWGQMAAALALLLLASAGIALTHSRGALLMLLAGGALLLASEARYLRRLGEGAWPIALGLFLALPLVALGVTAVAGRTLSKLAAAGDDLGRRFEALHHFGAISLEAPWFGHGFGQFDTLNARHLTPEAARTFQNFGAAHSAPIHAALEAGWPFALLLSLAMIAALWRVLAAWRRMRPSLYARAALLGVAGTIGCALGDIALNVPAVAALTAFLGGITLGDALAGER